MAKIGHTYLDPNDPKGLRRAKIIHYPAILQEGMCAHDSASLYGIPYIETTLREPTEFKQYKITSSNVAYDLLKHHFGDVLYDRERILALYLSRRNMVRAIGILGEGSINAVVPDLHKMYQQMILLKTPNVIIAHNHPSGNTSPSESDTRLAKKLNTSFANDALSSNMLDFLIIAGDSYCSFSDTGLNQYKSTIWEK